jgi:hypothetical protein
MTACQIPGGCLLHATAAFYLTYRTAPLAGRSAGPGATFTLGVCRSHADPLKDQIRAEGGSLVAVETLPLPAGPIQPEPIGLDALTPAPEKPVRVPRKRRGGGRC